MPRDIGRRFALVLSAGVAVVAALTLLILGAPPGAEAQRKKVSVNPSMIPKTGPPGLRRAARKYRLVVGSNHTMSSPLT